MRLLLRIAVAVIFIAIVAVGGLVIAWTFKDAPAAPNVRSAHQQLEAPFSRGECRDHQYIVIETDAHGVEREIDESQFCDITE